MNWHWLAWAAIPAWVLARIIASPSCGRCYKAKHNCACDDPFDEITASNRRIDWKVKNRLR